MKLQFRDRRLLLKSAAALGAWAQCGVARSTSPNEKLNVGVIGVGGRGSDNLAALADENIAALCDVDERVLGTTAERYPKATTQRDFRKLLEQNDLDAVVVATPNHTHAVAAIAALERGLHVYCEKPLAHTFDESQRMVAAARQAKRATQMGNQHHAARQAKRATQMGNQHHASPGYRRAVQILESGVLGEVTEVHAWTSRPLWPQGIDRPTAAMKVPAELDWGLWIGPAPMRPFHTAYVPRLWRGWWDFGGGALGDFVPHILDPVYEGLRLGSPVSISPTSAAVNDQTLPEWSVVQFDFPARDKQPPVTLTWYDGGKQPSEKVTRVKRLASSGALVIGKRGRLFVPELGKAPITMANVENQSLTLPAALPPPERTHWGEWVHACKTNAPTSSDFAYGAGLCEIALLGNIALRVRSKVQWDPKSSRFTNHGVANQLLSRDYREGWRLE